MKNKTIAVVTALMLLIVSCIGGLTFTAQAAGTQTGAALIVRSESNFFDDNTSISYANGIVPRQVMVDYYLEAPQYRIINGQYTLRYDPTVLRFSEESNMDEDDNYTLCPVAKSVVANFDYSYGEARFNFSNGDNPKLLVKTNGTPVAVVHLVFDVIGEGDTTVYLDVFKQTFTDLVPKTDYNDWYVYYAEAEDQGESVKTMFRNGGAKIYTEFSPDYNFPPGKYIFGDVNLDGIVDITDATLVQLHIVGKPKLQLKGIKAFLADVDDSGDIDITDATFIQLYSNNSSRELKRTGDPFVVPEPAPTQPTTQKPTQPTTQKPTQKPTVKPTTQPVTQPTTQKPSGKSLTVTATSNVFPQASTTFDPVTNQFTVTWWINITADKMVNTQFAISYDKNVLSYDTTDGVNQVYDEDDPDDISNYLVLRATKGDGTVINTEPESMPDGGIRGNASRLKGYKLTNSDGRVPFISVTFNPKKGAQGQTTVHLDVEILQLGSGSGDTYSFINQSEIVNHDISYLPNGVASAVYAGTFRDVKDDPQPTQPATQPTTQAPTQPVTQPVTQPSGKSLTVAATSNILPQATTTFNPVTDQITVTWWINITADKMVNTQFSITYDKSKLEFDETDGVNQVYDEDFPDEIANSLVLRATKGNGTVINTDPESMPNGGILGNASRPNGFKLTNADNRVPFVSVTFKPKEGAEGTTVVNLNVEILQLGDSNNGFYYFINQSQIVNSDISYLPSGAASAVYAGAFDETAEQPTDPTPSKALTVAASSNIFPQASTTFNPDTKQVTVTWWINIESYKMVNTQFAITYDKSKLEFDTADGVNLVYDEDDLGDISNYLVLRATNGDGTIINTNPESMPNGGILGNASRINGFKLTNSSKRVPFVSVTFKPKNGAEGITSVNLDVQIMQLGNSESESYYLIDRSKVVDNDISYLPSGSACAVYAGTFDANKQ